MTTTITQSQVVFFYASKFIDRGVRKKKQEMNFKNFINLEFFYKNSKFMKFLSSFKAMS